MFPCLHVVEKIQSQQDPDSSSSPKTPIKTHDSNHQPITKSYSNHNSIKNHPITSSSQSTVAYRTNGSIVTPQVPNPPVRNPLKKTIPKSRSAHPRRKSLQSAAEQLGVKSPPPMRVNGGTDSAQFWLLFCSICSFGDEVRLISLS